MKGLKEELRAPVQLFKPRPLTHAVNQAKLMENTLEVWGRKGKFTQKQGVSTQLITRSTGGNN